MGNDISNVFEMQTNVTNSYTQSIETNCVADCSISVSDNTVIIGAGSTVDGGICIGTGCGDSTTACSADAACSMVQSADATSNNILSAMVDQEIDSVTQFFGGFQSTDIDSAVELDNAISNYVTQISSQTCQASSDISVDSNTLFIGAGSDISGGIAISGTAGNATASCSMTNMAKLSVYNEMTTDNTQQSSTDSMFTAMAGAMIAMVVVAGIVVVAIFLFGGLGVAGLGVAAYEMAPEDFSLDPSTVATFATGMGLI